MAQTKKKRRRKHRGTQGGRIDTRPKGRPANRAEARQRAKSRSAKGGGNRKRGVSAPTRGIEPPTWRSAINKGVVAAIIFFVLIAFVFGRGAGPAAGLAAFMLLFYIPMSYYLDRFFYNRNLSKQLRERAEKQQQKQD